MNWDREIRLEKDFACKRETLWEYWSTEEGLACFFGAKQSVDFRIDGRFEILFLLDQPEGSRGSEGCRILRLEAPRRIAFTWNAPPNLPNCRNQHTVVEVRCRENGDHSQLTLLHNGFGVGDEWDACVAYFERAWTIVLDNLEQSISSEEKS